MQTIQWLKGPQPSPRVAATGRLRESPQAPNRGSIRVRSRLLSREKIVGINLRLPENRPQRAFGHVSWMIRNSGVTVRLGIEPRSRGFRPPAGQIESRAL